jgi:putative ATP-binding cassette transporter
VWEFVGLIVLAAPLFSLNVFLEDRLVLSWRAYLTRTLLESYFSQRSYYHLKQQCGDGSTELPLSQAEEGPSGPPHKPAPGASSSPAAPAPLVDNPDQRICDDTAQFCRSSTSIILMVVKKLFNSVAFASEWSLEPGCSSHPGHPLTFTLTASLPTHSCAGVLWSLSPTLVYFLFLYATIGTIATTAVFGRVLTSYYFRLLAAEANTRFALVRIREHAESIAFYRGK